MGPTSAWCAHPEPLDQAVPMCNCVRGRGRMHGTLHEQQSALQRQHTAHSTLAGCQPTTGTRGGCLSFTEDVAGFGHEHLAAHHASHDPRAYNMRGVAKYRQATAPPSSSKLHNAAKRAGRLSSQSRRVGQCVRVPLVLPSPWGAGKGSARRPFTPIPNV